jgi:replicative DNA helicase
MVSVPPHDIEAEKVAVLGSLLMTGDSIVKVVEFLRPKHFYNGSPMKRLFESNSHPL